ncbi:hypothetical protein Bhyg_15666 [Pseudolycoriella hygida]|uniref:Uncharacterized protein n=1 Tax=Pseudolycoriella hygida TaxID=35572 RepID=A0A9Q0RVK0_9DIPT|nr:hypothetical protein Bhyg_15666 [Pseudolycoriella hygida]
MYQQSNFQPFPDFTQPPPIIQQSFPPIDDSTIDKFLIDRNHLKIQRNEEIVFNHFGINSRDRLNVIQINLNNLIQQQQCEETNLRNNVAHIPPSVWEDKINLLKRNQMKIQQLLVKLETLSSEVNTTKTIKRKRRKKQKLKKPSQHIEPESASPKEVDKPLQKSQSSDLEESYEKYEVDRLRAANIKRINECKRQLKLLDSLIELRCIRRKSSHVGATSTASNEKYFIEKIDRLKSKWTDALTKCTSLENEIHMLSTQTVSKLWLDALFSNSESSVLEDDASDFNKLLDVRRSWDLCLVNDENVFGSSIPPGWVMPNPNPSAEWASFLVEQL